MVANTVFCFPPTVYLVKEFDEQWIDTELVDTHDDENVTAILQDTPQ
ncbi:hypothetical protein RNAN_0961 [Rheinheimera nanhaiensis E407-8]|uniref:Uncharacterized protein n=1 Tax=Rheinheimera nanhaiensis E407-8 TaxID=562729 RepID=I1DVB2_9GAMM|nr:hypothetical protein RNAN_0961 [Rheinheimera nanhaiensis E407-8]